MDENPDHKAVTIITTHVNADYDAIASMLAAQKLYPDSVVVFPGSHEKNLKNFFISSLAYLFKMIHLKDIKQLKIKRIVLVDTNKYDRLGAIAPIIENSDVDIHIYDHHPPEENSIKGSFEAFETTGATITILVKILKERKISLSPEEATIMCLGIYEDTGSFTYPSTTEEDFNAAAFLLSKGANLDVISNLISKEINPEQIACLNDMIQSASRNTINGIEIVTTTISTETYIRDLAGSVQKMMRIDNISVIFVIARMANKIYIIARSKLPEVDAGLIISQLGGGGHPYAASVTIKDKTLAQAEEALNTILHKEIKSVKLAKNLMSSPPISIEPDVSCKKAGELLTRYNINSILVVDEGKTSRDIKGFITRQVVEKALYHKLENATVSEFMTSEIITADLETPFVEIQGIIIDNKQRIVPIIGNEIIAGVITRTDLLNILVQESQLNTGKFPDPVKRPFYARTKNIERFMKERIPENRLALLRKIGYVASQSGYGVYVVGGFVRDLLMYRDNDDIDIVIEGNGITFAREFASIEGARVNTYEKFGTAVIILPSGFKIDVASARMEYYKEPAALPEIEMSSIKMDLYRRDFSINTLAIRLDPDHFGILIDFFAAQRDIKDKAIRIIHNLSFVEDPTRVFRAIKFEKRFNFTIGQLTSDLIDNAVKMNFFERLGGVRVFSELKQILEEEDPIPAIIRLFDYELVKYIHPDIKLSNDLIDLLQSIKKVISWHDLLYDEEKCEKWVLYFMALMEKHPKAVGEEISDRLKFSPRHVRIFTRERFKTAGILLWFRNNLDASNSALYNRLSPLRTELILYIMAVTENETIKMAISHYFGELRRTKIYTQGRDIKSLGIPPGPQYKKLLKKIFDAKLDGIVFSKKDELNYLKQII